MYYIIGILIFLVLVVVAALKLKPKKAESPKIVEQKKPVETLMPIQIYFGSQQGTAAKFAKILAEEGRKEGFDTTDVDLLDVEFDKQLINGKVGIFLLATHYEGDPTDNAKRFHTWMQDKQPTLKDFRYTVFGLGNTQYEHYNRMGRSMDKAFEDQQSIRIYKYGEGDDNSTLEEDFNSWKQNIWSELKVILKDLINKSKPVNTVESKYNLIKVDGPEQWNKTGEFEFQTKQFLKAELCPIIAIEQLRQNENDGSTLLLKIDVSQTQIKYKTAMNIGVFPQNTLQDIEDVSKLLNEDLNNIYDLQIDGQKKIKLPFPSPISVKSILTYFCDFQGQIMKKTLKDLSQLALNEETKCRLEFLSSNEGRDEFKNEIEGKKKTIIDIIREFNFEINLSQFITICPRISPRLYTIASSNLKYPDEIHIAASLQFDLLDDGRKKVGLCSKHFLDLIQNKQQIRIDYRDSNFKIQDINNNILMIGPGTGVAPFIGFIQERSVFLQNNQQKTNKYILYFGCKHRDGDFIFRDFLQQSVGVVDELHLAFSRDQINKIYVQDLLLQHADEIIKMIDTNSVQIFICGQQFYNLINFLKFTDLHKWILVNPERDLKQAQEQIQLMEKGKLLIKELW